MGEPAQFHDRRRDDGTAHERLDALVTRMDAVERWMEGFKLQMTEVGAEVKANTRLTEEIHGDTKDLVEAMRWVGTTRRYVIHACGIVVAVAGVAKLFGLL